MDAQKEYIFITYTTTLGEGEGVKEGVKSSVSGSPSAIAIFTTQETIAEAPKLECSCWSGR